jgi:hypothetical protein
MERWAVDADHPLRPNDPLLVAAKATAQYATYLGDFKGRNVVLANDF